MGVTASTEIYGLKAALNELGKIDSKTRFKAINQIKASGNQMVSTVSQTYPDFPPLRGMTQSKGGTARLGYDPNKVRKGVQIQVGGRQRGTTVPMVTLIQKNAGGALFDIAGLRDRSSQFVRQLDANYGKAQRGMWRQRAYIYEQATKDILEAIEQVMNSVNRTLG